APLLIGRDPDQIEDIWQFLFRGTYWRGGPVLMTALAGIDLALWDIKGKRAGLPLYSLLGGRTRKGALAYSHAGGREFSEVHENELFHDVHERLSPIQAARLAKELEPFHLFFLEDPLRPEHKESFRLIRQHSVTPIAMGELFNTKYECLPLITEQLIDYIRCD